jgi:hypothetical protein
VTCPFLHKPEPCAKRQNWIIVEYGPAVFEALKVKAGKR